jgi:uncharacterized protein YkwD
LVNVERSKEGLGSLAVNARCVNEAQFHAQDMAINNYYSHDGLTETWAERKKRFGLGSYTGENIVAARKTPAEAMDAWMNSSGHRANILNGNYKSMGVGVATDSSGKMLWVQCFSGDPK